MARTCPNPICHYRNQARARFCARCGLELAVAGTASGIPAGLAFGFVALGLCALIHLVLGLVGGVPHLVAAGAIEVALLVALIRRHRWARVIVILLSAVGLIFALATMGIAAGFVVLLLNAAVVLPLLVHADYFWDRDNA